MNTTELEPSRSRIRRKTGEGELLGSSVRTVIRNTSAVLAALALAVSAGAGSNEAITLSLIHI